LTEDLTGAADQNDIALIGHEAAGGQIFHQTFVDWRAGKVELFDVFCQWQLCDGHLVADGPCLFLGNLGLQQIAHDARGFVLALDAGGHDLVIGAAHSVELQRSHQVEDLGSFHGGLFS
jgi:hypothetical protein